MPVMFRVKIRCNTPLLLGPEKAQEIPRILRALADEIDAKGLVPDASTELWALTDSRRWPCGFAKLFVE